MEDHDQRKSHQSSGNEGHHRVHHCNKCGWPFPNPHPSAKHRRAHRRICGTIEGYKLEGSPHLNVSDDEHSDDDHKTPSTKAFERSENEKGSDGIDARSISSEDEVFSDAASNFVDVTSGMLTETALENALESESTIEKVKEHIPAHRTTAEVMQADDSTDSAEKQDQVVPESTSDVLGSKPDAQDHFSSSPIDIIVDSAEKSIPAATSEDLIDNSVFIKLEASIALIEESKKPGEDIAVSECLLEFVSQDREVMVVKESNSSSCNNSNVSGSPGAIQKLEESFETTSIPMAPEVVKLAEETDPLSLDNNSTSDTPEASSKLEETFEMSIPKPLGDVKLAEETNPVSLDDNNGNDTPEAIQKLEETCKTVAIPVPPTELLPEERASSQVSLSGDIPLVELDMDRKLEVSTSSNGIHENDKGEEDEKFQVFFVPHDVPKVENLESIVEGFKDHKRMGWFQPDNSGTFEGNPEKDHIIFMSPESRPEAVEEVSEVCSDLLDPKDASKLEAEKTKPVDKEVFIKGELISHYENKGLTDLEIFKDDSTAHNVEVGGVVNPMSEREFLGSVHTPSGGSTEFLSWQTSTAASLETDDQSVDDKYKAEIAHIAETDQMDKHIKFEEILREEVLESTSRTETADVAEEYDNSKRETEESLTENLNVPESAMNLQDARANSVNPIVEDSTSGHEKQDKEKLGVTEEDAMESVDTTQESREPENKPDCNTEAVIVSQERVSTAHEKLKEGQMNGKDETMLQFSEDRVVEGVLVTLDTASSGQASAAIGVGRDDDLSGHRSSHLQLKGENNHVTQPVAGSSVDASVDSRSTDSLDANWGSVSVLSAQSDNSAAVKDSKAISSTLNLPISESEVVKSSDKLEVLEPPSFMTLPEPARKGEKMTASPNQGQPRWFPSLTNVPKDSPGRKKNEEIIAKVSNWSSNQLQHSPLKGLLMEANQDAKLKSSNMKENVLVGAQEENSVTMGSMLGSEAQKAVVEKQATPRQCNTPARAPTEIKREKRKVKGRPYWGQFVCCYSVN